MRCSHDTVTETVVVLPREIRHMDVRTEQALSAHGKTTQPGAGRRGTRLCKDAIAAGRGIYVPGTSVGNRSHYRNL